MWVDDDTPTRFRYERRLLARQGWNVLWAEDIDSARALLATESFDALIVDQSLPFLKGQTATGIQGGYQLLHWIRKGVLPDSYDLPQPNPPAAVQPPLPINKICPVLFISAFYDSSLHAKLRELSEVDQEIEIVAKPLDPNDLLRFLSRVEVNHAA